MCKGLAALPHTCLERAKEIKTKLGTLLQKPDSSVDLIIPYSEKPEKPAKLQKPSAEEAWQWRNSLEKLLQNPYGLASFQNFLKSEFSEENIEFWIACEDYKKIKFPSKMTEKAKKIYEEFIQSEAPKEVSCMERENTYWLHAKKCGNRSYHHETILGSICTLLKKEPMHQQKGGCHSNKICMLCLCANLHV
uniref:RGS domain-containing protein n=1 Tax=Anolis carolinensis TaxID=28377 RepID=A0A803TZY7_ANOCA